jgi:hypothetical protein
MLTVGRHKAERNAKGFPCWGQLVAMLFCPLGSVNSLRDIVRPCLRRLLSNRPSSPWLVRRDRSVALTGANSQQGKQQTFHCFQASILSPLRLPVKLLIDGYLRDSGDPNILWFRSPDLQLRT